VLVVSWVLFGAFILSLIWIGWRAWLVKDELEALIPLVEQAKAATEIRDLDALEAVAEETSEHAARAAELTGEPIWSMAEAMPVVGANFAAVRIVSQNLDALTGTAVLPLTDIVRQVQESGSAGGEFDLATMAAAQEPLSAAAGTFTTAATELKSIDASKLLGPVSEGVRSLTDFVGHAAPIVDAFDRAARALPPMLGSDEPRQILVMVQNGAELRTGGGISGSFILLSASGGRISIADQTDAAVFPVLGEPIIELPESVVDLYGDVVGQWVQNTTMPSDFDLTAELAVAWWTSAGQPAPDTVVSVDVPALAAMLGAIGPIPLDDGRALGPDNLVEILLTEPYLTMDGDEQTAFQRAITRNVFSHAMSASLSPLKWGEALIKPIEEGRISVWSARPEEQAVFEGTLLAGPAARHESADPAVSIYLNDATAGKLDLFLGVEMGLAELDCRSDGRHDLVVEVTLTNEAPEDAGERFSDTMTGAGLAGVPRGHIATNVTAAGPAGSFVGGVRIDGDLSRTRLATESGFPSSVARVTLAPGESKTIEFRFVASGTGEVNPDLLHTPMLREPTIEDIDASCR